MTDSLAATIDGVAARLFTFPETETNHFEYRAGACLVQVIEEPGERRLNVRHANQRQVYFYDGVEISEEEYERLARGPGYDPRLWWGWRIVGDFAELWACYSAACARHGFKADDERSAADFFNKTRGYGVLWGRKNG